MSTPKPKKPKQKKCRACGKKFTPRREWQLDCSRLCRNRGYWHRHPERAGEPLHVQLQKSCPDSGQDIKKEEKKP